jgi:hypothetical protein
MRTTKVIHVAVSCVRPKCAVHVTAAPPPGHSYAMPCWAVDEVRGPSPNQTNEL